MINFIKYSCAILFACVLSGCGFNASQQPASIEPGTSQADKPVQPQATPPISGQQPPPVVQPQPVPEQPKLQSIDWTATVQPLAQRMVTASGVAAGSVLLVDRFKNATNGSIQSANANSALQQALAGSPFTLVTKEQLDQAKLALGIGPNDSLNSRGKAIGLARNLNAKYVLSSTVRGDIKAARIQMQLMLVETGEIIWTGSGAASY